MKLSLTLTLLLMLFAGGVWTANISEVDCVSHYENNSELCLEINNYSLKCNDDYSGKYFENCKVIINYKVSTDWEGNNLFDNHLHAVANCTSKISKDYFIHNSRFSEIDTRLERKSSFLSSNETLSETVTTEYSFPSFEKVISLKVLSIDCEADIFDPYKRY